MSKRKGFEKLSLILVTALLAGACSPLAPSVSKLSNAAAEKTTPTDASAPSSNVSGSGAVLSSSQHSEATASVAQQSTSAMPFSRFSKQWKFIQDVKPSLVLDKSAVEELARSGVVSFPSRDRVKGNEEQLAGTKIKILLVMNSDQAGIVDAGVDEVATQVKWVSGEGSHWELSLVSRDSGDGDAVKLLNDLKSVREALKKDAVAIAIEFQAD
ncbi:MAG: hypothetical protein HY075_16030 [Deltaproteobacteria bacterium]|nr:hypothetical protein [Deltaproteobacteria bacterium]